MPTASHLFWAVSAVSSVCMLIQRSRLSYAEDRWRELHADMDAMVEALDAGNEKEVAKLCGRHRAREKFSRPPLP